VKSTIDVGIQELTFLDCSNQSMRSVSRLQKQLIEAHTSPNENALKAQTVVITSW
jgi:hypothetical protein